MSRRRRESEIVRNRDDHTIYLIYARSEETRTKVASPRKGRERDGRRRWRGGREGVSRD